MDYTVEDVLKDVTIWLNEFDLSKKKRLRILLDKRNYLVAILHYKFGMIEEELGKLFKIDRSSISLAKKQTPHLLKIGDPSFILNAKEYIEKFPFQFPEVLHKNRLKKYKCVLFLENDLFKSLKKYQKANNVVDFNTTIIKILQKNFKNG
jgi:hypothetical protein